MLVGLERLDPIKGLIEKLEGYREFLKRYPQYRGQVVLRQAAQASRMDIKAYQDLDRQFDELVEQINRENQYVVDPKTKKQTKTPHPAVIVSKDGWNRDFVLSHLSIADAVMINSLRDGMNLVAFESEVTQRDRENPAVLILSQEAGAASWLPGAVIVDPTSPSQIAEAIHQAIEMSVEERRERNIANLAHIDERTSITWTRDSLAAIAATFKVP